jgi:nicotinamidase-related amidase
LTQERAFTVLKNCRLALGLARRLGWPVAHVRNAAGSDRAGSETIAGFEPGPLESVLERRGPSCYTSPFFAEVVRQTGGIAVVSGFFGSGGVLATIADAVQSLDQLTLLLDASLDEESSAMFSGQMLSFLQRYTRFQFSALTTRSWIETVEASYVA